MTTLELFDQGGPLMWAILLASVIGLTFFIERLWFLQRSRIVPRAFVDRIRVLVSKKKTSQAQLLCEENTSAIARVLLAALRCHSRGRTREQLREAVDETGAREVSSLERNLELVGTVAAIAPLLGLLGTVVGMIDVFRGFVEAYKEGNVGPDMFAEGIWQALITTAFGLFVAIPMLIAYKYLQGRSDRLVVLMEEESMGVVDMLDNLDAEPEAAA